VLHAVIAHETTALLSYSVFNLYPRHWRCCICAVLWIRHACILSCSCRYVDSRRLYRLCSHCTWCSEVCTCDRVLWRIAHVVWISTTL